MKRLVKTISSFFLTLIVYYNASAIDDVRLLRFPDINKNLIAFVYAGDIWTVSSTGGEARRLTSHDGLELFPKISPDGQWIAFSGEYSGSRQVFVIPSNGGVPRQLTWYNSVGVMPPRGGWDNVVLDWTPDSRQVLIRANRTSFGERQGKYFLVNLDGKFEKPLQIVNGGFGVLSPDGSRIVFTPVDREFRNWKRYKGGRATDLWIYNLKENKSEQITNFEGTDQLPTWSGDNIFFASDRDLKLNIWQYNTVTKETKQVTRHTEFDVMWPSGSGDQLVYENGGYLYRLSLQSGQTASELGLLHLDWVNQRRAMVDKLSGGKIGYIYVPNTSADGNRELFQGMYTYFDKEALIIDERYNGGGFIPDRMADLLDRHTLVFWQQKGLTPGKSPAIAHDGPKAMLINGYSASGGDAFPYFFKKLGLGKLIGTRTWGGLVGISGNARLVDGGYISVPRFGVFDQEEGWIIEGVGVYPDIEVVERPEQMAKGIDSCIEKAVEVLLQELKEKPAKKVTVPASPDRSKWREN